MRELDVTVRLRTALDSLGSAEREALRAAHERIRAFHERQVQSSWDFREADGTRLGFQTRRRDEFIEIMSDGFGRGVTEQVGELAIHAHNFLVWPLDCHGFRRMLKELLEVGLLQQQLLFCKLAFVDVDADSHDRRLALILDRGAGKVHPPLLSIADSNLDLKTGRHGLPLSTCFQPQADSFLHLDADELQHLHAQQLLARISQDGFTRGIDVKRLLATVDEDRCRRRLGDSAKFTFAFLDRLLMPLGLDGA